MARIRSTHPGQWTDEAFVSCSPFARLLALALRNEADDNGVFEWKPLTLKMRLLPADDVNMEQLLQELVSTDQVAKYEVCGKYYGAIRNFRQYQRPKSPTPHHPLPNDFREYVGLKPTPSEGVPQRGETTSEKSPQMEDGGCRRDVTPHPPSEDAPPKVDKRGSRLPDGWIPSDALVEWVVKNAPRSAGVTPMVIVREGAHFRDYWISQPGQKGVKRDWEATWRNWWRKKWGWEAENQDSRAAASDMSSRLLGELEEKFG